MSQKTDKKPDWMRSELLEKQGWSQHREAHKDCPNLRCLFACAKHDEKDAE